MAEFIRGFHHLSRAWYGEFCLANVHLTDEVSFDLYAHDGEIMGEACIRWVTLDKPTPKVQVFYSSWKLFTEFRDLFDKLAEFDGYNLTPEQFCEILLNLGFVDMTEIAMECNADD